MPSWPLTSSTLHRRFLAYIAMSWQGHRKAIRRQRNSLGLAIDGRQQPDQQQRTEHVEPIRLKPLTAAH